MTSLLDGLLALLLAGFLNLLVLYQIRARTEPAEKGFLVRVYLWTILLRYSVAIALNAFAGDSAFAAASWGDSGSYDTGGHQLALKWSGEPITTAYMSRGVMWGQSGFGREYDVSTPTGALSALPTGLVYLLFAPFPWAVSGLRQALAVPETLVWYALIPAFIRGLAFAVKRQLRAILPILVFAVSLTAAYALMQGNVGTAYRQRTQITMSFFIFMGVGLAERRRQRDASAAVASPTGWRLQA